MAKRAEGPLDGTIEEVVARAAKVSNEDAADFLERHNIRAQALIPRPVNVTVKGVRFRGVKSIHGIAEPYEFRWQELGPGLWLVGSGKNSKGKTSLLAVIRWLLRGKQPESLTDTVRGWIEHAELDFDVGGVPHRTMLQLSGSYAARVTRDIGSSESIVIEASTPEDFASAMSDYMMSQLQLEPVANLRVERGTDLQASVTQHAWPALFGAFHVGTDYSSLLGSSSMAGLPTRMLNMFAGFPHAGAVAKVQLVLAALKLDEEREGRSQRAVAIHAQSRLARLQEELTVLGLPGEGESAGQAALEAARELSARLARLYSEVSTARREEAEAKVGAGIPHARATFAGPRGYTSGSQCQ